MRDGECAIANRWVSNRGVGHPLQVPRICAFVATLGFLFAVPLGLTQADAAADRRQSVEASLPSAVSVGRSGSSNLDQGLEHAPPEPAGPC